MGLLSSPTVDLQLAPQTGLDTTSTTLQGVSARGSTMCMISHNVHDVLMSLKKRCASKLAGHMLLLALVESFWVKFNIRACTQSILLFLPTRFGSRPRHGFDHRYAHQSLAFKPKACRVLLPQPPTNISPHFTEVEGCKPRKEQQSHSGSYSLHQGERPLGLTSHQGPSGDFNKFGPWCT